MADENDLLEDIAAYEDEEALPEPAVAAGAGDAEAKKKATYSGLHSSGFRDLVLKPELLQAIVDCGFEHPSEVQQQCIPQAILGTDVLCQAKAGMGKTAVFVIAVLQQLEPVDGEVHALVMGHTRELAFQICHEFERFSKYLPTIKTAVFFGGFNINEQIKMLKTSPPHVAVGTPGRILDLANKKALNLSTVKHFVLDECDHMLGQLSMRRDVQEILRFTPHEKQVMMFTATLSDEFRDLSRKFMHHPTEILVNEESKLVLDGLQQHYLQLTEGEKTRKLVGLLDSLQFNQAIVFVSSVQRAIHLNQLLVDSSFPSICIHSSMKQEERVAKYKAFKDFNHRILVATNLIGRGIDIERVNVVINYDMPDDPDVYIHRVGRAGRFGGKGLTVTFVASESDTELLNKVQERFLVNLTPLPDVVDPNLYMNA
eukprot:a509855_89.p2 GENE.a509855_89~~a509855_89.p2  ORF type:complete len:439 (+),score=228.26 a509855_89:36-1319(+)